MQKNVRFTCKRGHTLIERDIHRVLDQIFQYQITLFLVVTEKRCAFSSLVTFSSLTNYLLI